MKKTIVIYALSLSALVLLFKQVEGSGSQGAHGAGEDYLEECQHEGCNSEEVRELCSSYTEECIGEGCSKEEVIELAGAPGSVQAMFSDMASKGCKVRQEDLRAATCNGIGTETSCAGVLLLCKDSYACPDGNFSSSWYVCGGCIGIGSCGSSGSNSNPG